MGDGYGYRCGERQFAGALLGQRIDSSGDTGFPWNRDDADVEQGIALANTFAKMEQLFLPSCFAPEALNESCVFMLPPCTVSVGIMYKPSRLWAQETQQNMCTTCERDWLPASA